MTTIKATVRSGRLEVEVPADWPDGTEVEIHPLMQEMSSSKEVLSPQEIASTLAAMDRMEPLVLTDAEQAKWEEQRRKRRECDMAEFAKQAEKLRQGWD